MDEGFYRARVLNAVSRYALAAVITAVCLAARVALAPILHKEAPFVTFYIGIVVSAVFFGLGPALLAALAGGLVTDYFFISPPTSFAMADAAWIVSYALASLTIIFFIEREHRAQRAAYAATQIAEQNYRALLEETAAKEEAQRSEERHRRWAEVTLASIGDAVISADAAGCVNFLNSIAEALTGWSLAEAAGKPISEVFQIVNECPQDTVESPILKLFTTGAAQILPDSLMVSKSGKRAPIADSGAPIRDSNGALIGVVLVFRDITELKKREDALRRNNEDLQRFAFIASHDMQQPLRTVAGFLTLLQARYRERFDTEGAKLIQFAMEGAERMQTLIRDLLEYSRIGAEALHLVPTDLNTVTDAVEADVSKLALETGAVLRRDPLPTLIADSVKIRQVLQNLVANSLKFRSSMSPEIRISSELCGDECVIAVHDNGIGFEPEYADQIFGMFQRLHSASKYPGSGIGLALCKRIVEEHGGRIWAESTPGVGSSFYFSLPVDRMAETNELRFDEATRRPRIRWKDASG